MITEILPPSTHYLLGDLMAVPDSIKVHTVGAQGVCHKVDFGELRLKELE